MEYGAVFFVVPGRGLLSLKPTRRHPEAAGAYSAIFIYNDGDVRVIT